MLSAENTDEVNKEQNYHDIQKIFYDFWKDKIPSENEAENGPYGGYQQFKRWEWFMKPRTYPTGEMFDPEILIKEFKKEKEKRQHMSVHRALTADNWTLIGPSVVPTSGGGVGRINCVRFDPTNANIIFAGTANGGLWKSTDGGNTWSTTTDYLPALGAADIAINPRYHDSIFVATGDRDGYEQGVDFWGGTYSAGIMLSTDGGNTWTTTGFTAVQSAKNLIYRLLINPINPNILLLAARTGIWRSVDAGATWIQVRTGRHYDMEFKADDPNTVFAVTSTALDVSTDGGATWTQRYNGLGSNNVIAVTPANPLVIYSFNDANAVRKSTDGGFTFTTMASPSSLISLQGFYDCAIAVSPTDANVVFCGGAQKVAADNTGGIVKSTNGGTSWTSIGSGVVHCDHHDLQFAPGSGTTIYNTNDGGIWSSTNTGTNWTNLSNGLAIKQYYRIGASALTANYLYGGAQDNGTDQWKAGTWKHVGGGDGMDCLMDYTSDNIAYISLYNAQFLKTTNGGTSFGALTLPAAGDWTTPMVMDPITHTTLYVGLTGDVYKSLNSGSSWTAISSNLFGTSTITSLAVAPSNPSYIYAAIFSKICRTMDGGANWTNITTGINTTNAGITWIAISSLDPMKIWVSMTGYISGNKVYYSSNGGATWTNISGSLPNIPANCITYQNNTNDAVYVGTDFGVYYRDASMSDWISYNNGFPNASVSELEIQYGNINKIRAATYGRSIWESDLNMPSVYTLDAGVHSIISPNAIAYCNNTFTPVVKIKNFGQTTITTLNINYQVDADPVQVFPWNGSLAAGATINANLPAYSSTPGTHSFTVYTSDPNSLADMNTFNDTRTISFDIHSVPLIVPVQEGFETTTYPPVNWSLVDPANLTQRFTSAGGFGNTSNSLKSKSWIISSSTANLISYPVNFIGLNTPVLKFSVAYARRNANSTERLRVLISTNCGTTYTQVYSKTGTVLATAPDLTGNFTPSAAQWRTDTIDLSAYVGQGQVMINFEIYGNAGNNLYLDDINLDHTVGIQEISSHFISVYPNPTNGNVHFTLPFVKENTSIEIYSPVGSLVKNVGVKSEESDIDISALSPGIYFYMVKNGNNSLVQGKLVRE